MEAVAGSLIPRAAQTVVEQALRRSPVVAVVGPRQCGKTTLTRQLVSADSPNYSTSKIRSVWPGWISG